MARLAPDVCLGQVRAGPWWLRAPTALPMAGRPWLGHCPPWSLVLRGAQLGRPGPQTLVWAPSPTLPAKLWPETCVPGAFCWQRGPTAGSGLTPVSCILRLEWGAGKGRPTAVGADLRCHRVEGCCQSCTVPERGPQGGWWHGGPGLPRVASAPRGGEQVQVRSPSFQDPTEPPGPRPLPHLICVQKIGRVLL